MLNTVHEITLETNTPRVSVIVPVFNAEKYLRQCLDTVINQTLKDIEIILIDDGSSDRSLSICHEYEKKDERVHVYTQQNQGVGATCNRGIKLAKGEYLAFGDSDDFFELNMLEKLYNKSITTDSEICVCRSKQIGNGCVESIPCALRTEYLWNNTFSLDDIFYSEHLYQAFIGWAWDKLFKRSFIEKYNIQFGNLRHFEDLIFVFTALAVTKKTTFINDELVYHRYYHNFPKTCHREDEKGFMRAVLMLYDYLVKLDVYDKCRSSFLKWVQSFCNYHYHNILNTPNRQVVIDCMRELAKKLSFDEHLCLKYLEKPFAPPKISVLIPIYNAEKYLDRAMQSVISQTLRDIEVICINDGSTDSSLEILKKYQQQDPRIRIIDKKNTGYGHSMNVGFQVACGEYIAILESDDCILPDMYEVLYKKAKEFNLDFIKADFYQFTDSNSGSMKKRFSVTEGHREDYNRIINPQNEPKICRSHVEPWTGIYNRSFLARNRILHNETPGASYQDNGLFIKTLCMAHRVMFIDQAFYMYRQDNPEASVKKKEKVHLLLQEHSLNRQWLLTRTNNPMHIQQEAYRKVCSLFWAIDTSDISSRKEVLSACQKELLNTDRRGEFNSSLYTEKMWKRLTGMIHH